MKSFINKLTKKKFIRNVVVVVTGTASAQAITVIFSPFITRLYGPEAFGVLGVFMAMVSIIGPVSALTYPIAIVLPKRDSEAKVLIFLSIFISFIIAMIIGIILMIFNKPLVYLLQIAEIAQYLFLIPLVIIFTTFLQVSRQWLIRTKQFKVTAKAAFINSLILNISKTGIGLFNPVASVLVTLNTFSNAFHAFLLSINSIKTKIKPKKITIKISVLKNIANKYNDFPLYRAPQTLVHVVSQSLPIILLPAFFGPAAAGYYSLSRSVLAMPITLIGESVGDVFYPRIVEAEKKRENLALLITRATLGLGLVGLIPFGIIIIFGPWLFGLIFGADWVVAGEYARWLTLGFYFGFINRPSARAIPVLNIQKQFLIYEIISGFIRGGILLLGFFLFENDVVAVALFSISTVLLNTYLIFFTIRKAVLYKN